MGEAPQDQQDLPGATLGLVKLGAGEGAEDPAAGLAAVIDDRGTVAAMDLQPITDPAARANEAAGVEDGDDFGVASDFVQIFRDGKVHGLAFSLGMSVFLSNDSPGKAFRRDRHRSPLMSRLLSAQEIERQLSRGFVAMQRFIEPQSQHVEQVHHEYHRAEEDEATGRGDELPLG